MTENKWVEHPPVGEIPLLLRRLPTPDERWRYIRGRWHPVLWPMAVVAYMRSDALYLFSNAIWPPLVIPQGGFLFPSRTSHPKPSRWARFKRRLSKFFKLWRD